MEFYPEIGISSGQAEAMGRGLFAVARAQGGVHERELMLIQSFYSEAAGGPLSTLEKSPDIEPEVLATALGDKSLAMIFLKTALLVAYADSTYAKEEQELIVRYACALGVSQEELAHLEQSVKEYLIGHLSGLSNVDATVAVARELGV